MKNPNWTRDEHIIALDFYLSHSLAIPKIDSLEFQKLLIDLKGLTSFLDHQKTEKFRNPHGVYMKLMNFRSIDPSIRGTGLTHKSSDAQIVWDLYAHRQLELSNLANKIKQFSLSEWLTNTNISEDEEESEEGRILSSLHRYRERDRDLVKKAKERFFKKNLKLFCQGCGFDFEKKYGERGNNYIECHHIKPVSELKPGEKTLISDLVLLCSNCHKIVHRKRPWLTFDELKKTIHKYAN